MDKKHSSIPPPMPTFVLRSFSSAVTCVTYDMTDPLRLYTAEQEGRVCLYDLRSRRSICAIPNAHTSTILCLKQINNENSKLITFGKDGFVKIWNENQQCVWDYQTNHCSFSNCDVVSPNLIVTPIGSEDSAVAILDYQCSNPIVKQFLPTSTQVKHGMIMKLRVYNNQSLFVAYENGAICVFDMMTTKQLDTYQVTTDYEPITTMDVVCNNCICGTTKSNIVSLDFSTFQLQPTAAFRPIEVVNAGTSVIRCRPDDGKLIAAAGWDFRIRLYRRETGKQLAMLDLHRQPVHSIDFDYKTRQMACASEDRTVSIWDIYNSKQDLKS